MVGMRDVPVMKLKSSFFGMPALGASLRDQIATLCEPTGAPSLGRTVVTSTISPLTILPEADGSPGASKRHVPLARGLSSSVTVPLTGAVETPDWQPAENRASTAAR